MITSNSVKVELFIKPSELEFILKVLDAFRSKKALEFTVRDQEEVDPTDFEKYITDGPPLTQEDLLRLVEKAEKSEKVDQAGFRNALGI